MFNETVLSVLGSVVMLGLSTMLFAKIRGMKQTEENRKWHERKERGMDR